ncbi:MAG: CRISPR-associated protein Cas2 [Spirochaetaceae bacterium]|jgi:CRISPR-associated protein Cas2|nr:CRISPR-associated protein Cas2 [Spirochaetaceae bacterium]
MFVSIAVDPGSEERAKDLVELLIQYGFEKIQRGLWESTAISPETLGRLKRDLDRSTDAFDHLRIFQYPVNGTLALSTLRDKKWRRLIAKGGDNPPAVQAAPSPGRTAAKPVRNVRHGRRATDL